MKDHLDDATRSKLANFLRKVGGGQLNLYAITERKPQICVLVVSTCSEEALKLIRDRVGLDWHVGNTTCRSVQRNIDAEPEVITAFKLRHHRVRSFAPAPTQSPSVLNDGSAA